MSLRALIGEVAAAPAQGTFWVGMLQRIQPGWHTYWRYGGDSGLPTRIE